MEKTESIKKGQKKERESYNREKQKDQERVDIINDA